MIRKGADILLFFILIGLSNNLVAAVYYACGTATWDGATSFVYTTSDCSSTALNPSTITATDTLVIQAGAVITVESSQTLNALRLEIYGTLYFNNTAPPPKGKITMPTSGANVALFPGSVLACVDSGIEETCGSASQLTVDGTLIKGNDIDDADNLPKPSTIDQGGATPVDLMFFNGRAGKNNVELTWATASEENFDYFSIERSADGYNFKEIAQVSGSGFSMTRMDYSYTDEFPLQGKSYYRLKSIDFDGYTEIFDYVMVNIEGLKNKFSIYPNPIENTSFKVQTNFEIKEAAQLVVYNNMGLVEQTFELTDWLATYTSAELQPGTYMFKLVTSEEVLVKRVLIK